GLCHLYVRIHRDSEGGWRAASQSRQLCPLHDSEISTQQVSGRLEVRDGFHPGSGPGEYLYLSISDRGGLLTHLSLRHRDGFETFRRLRSKASHRRLENRSLAP